MIFRLLAAALVFASAARADVEGFSKHLRDAIASNSDRLPRYAKLTRGQSRLLSRTLIGVEYLSLGIAWWLEWHAAPYRAAGIPILVADFTPMRHTPPFLERYPGTEWESGVEFHEHPVGEWARRLSHALDEEGFAGVHRLSLQYLGTLKSNAYVHCLVRHVIESAARMSHLAPQYEAMAAARKMASPAWISRRLLKLHFESLGLSHWLDRRAAPMQARGVPILCRDVPPIDPEPDLAAWLQESCPRKLAR